VRLEHCQDKKFNKSAIIRTVRELSTIGYFNPEKITPNPIPKADGTVDIEYNVEENLLTKLNCLVVGVVISDLWVR
jgi:outer membrane protein assembly factor BamA